MSSEHYRQAAILASFVQQLREAGKDCGETLMQKAAYVMKELFGVPLRDEFRIHYYGPFSFELRDRLASMEADDIVRVQPREMGVTYEIGERFSQLRTRFAADIEAASRAIAFTADRLGSLGVKKLEPLTTALYVTREMPRATTQERARRLREIKQHIPEREAIQAVETIDCWQSEVTQSVGP